ncbi:unnamed protein product [Lactuca saligna]|uniref:Uncharacterized protein n=1 Tax=Lactuca saligna TaxID=75948 RepID=A0AA35ZQD0_LACSI|nr:unnamed protein product [Lactuca saligna]
MLETKLHYAEKQVDDLLAEKAITRSCISDVTGLLSGITETHDPMISITVKKHLSEMLRPVFAMLHRLEGVSKPMHFPKQGEKADPKIKRMNSPKLQLNLLSSSKNQRRKKTYSMKNPLLMIVKTKSLMKLSSKGGRLTRHRLMNMIASSERQKKKKELKRKLKPFSKAKCCYFQSGP